MNNHSFFRFAKILLVLLALAVSGCGRSQPKLKAPRDDEAAFDHIALLLRQRSAMPVGSEMPEEMKGSDPLLQLEKIASFVPADPPLSSKLVGWRFTTFYGTDGSHRVFEVTKEYEYPKKWLLLSMDFQERDGVRRLTWIWVQPLNDSLENCNRFTLVGKSAGAYAMLALVIFVPLFVLGTLIVCIRTRVRRKWLWLIAITLGIGQLSINWTTGHFAFAIFCFQLFSAGFSAQFYGSWIFSISLPVGAIAFLALRKTIALPPKSATPPPLP